MLYLAAFKARANGAADPAAGWPVEPVTCYPADLSAARQAASDFVAAVAARCCPSNWSGSPMAVRVAWSRADRAPDGSPDRAPNGLPDAIATLALEADLSADAGTTPPSIGRSLYRPIAPIPDRSMPIALSGEIAPMIPVAPISFRFSGAGLGLAWFLVMHGRDSFRLEIREQAGPAERRISTSTEAEWNRDIVGSVGVLRYGSDPTTPVPQEIVAAFNEWRLRDYVQLLADIAAAPERFGTPGNAELIRMAPKVAHAARWTPAGWIAA